MEEFVNRDVQALGESQIICIADPEYCKADGLFEQAIYKRLHSVGLHRRQIYAYLTLLRQCWHDKCDILQTVQTAEELLNLDNPDWKSEFLITEEKKNSESETRKAITNSYYPSYLPNIGGRTSSMFQRHGRRFGDWTRQRGASLHQGNTRVKRSGNNSSNDNCQTAAPLSLLFSINIEEPVANCKRERRRNNGLSNDK